MAWFPCNIGGGSPEPTPVPVSMNVKTTSTDGYTASVKLTTYDDVRDVLYSTVMGESNAIVFGAVKLYYASAWYLKASTTCEYNGNTYNEGDLIRTWNYTVNVDMDINYTVPARGNATMKQGTFVSASSQYGIVDVNCGFEPDMVMVKLPFTGGDTVSYWEKGLSYAQNSAIWCLKPAEDVVYEVALGRQSGETGIQAINNNGFSFMSNGGNTQGVTCEYIAVKYEVPQPTPVVPFEKEILSMLVQDGIPNPATYSLTFTEDVKYALIAFGIDDNVNDRGFLSFNGTPIFYIDKMAYGIVPIPSNKVLTGTFPYSDGGAEFLYYGALGMNRLPSDFAIRTSSYTGSSLSITLDKVYDHVVILHAFDHGSSNSITVSVNGETLNYTVLPYKWNKYTYYGIHEMEPDSTTLNFTFSVGTSNNKLIVFAYND